MEIVIAFAKVKKTKKHIEIIVVPLNSGNLKLPDIELTIDGKKTIIKVKKEKVLPQTKPTDLRLKPIKPMKKVIEKDYRLIYLLAFILLLIFVVFIIKKLFLNRKKIIICYSTSKNAI